MDLHDRAMFRLSFTWEVLRTMLFEKATPIYLMVEKQPPPVDELATVEERSFSCSAFSFYVSSALL